LAAGNSAPDSHSLPPPLPPQRDGEEKWTKGETRVLRERQFNETTKQSLIIILLIIRIIMKMQNTLWTIQFFSPPDEQFTA